MQKIRIKLDGQRLTATPEDILVSKSVGEVMATVEMDPSWAGYTVVLVFFGSRSLEQKPVLYTGSEVEVPWEVLDKPGRLWISAVGIAEGKRRPTARVSEPLTITSNGRIVGNAPEDYSPALWEQALTEIQRLTTASSVTSEDVLEILAETGTAVPVTDNNGAVYTGSDGKIYCI